MGTSAVAEVAPKGLPVESPVVANSAPESRTAFEFCSKELFPSAADTVDESHQEQLAAARATLCEINQEDIKSTTSSTSAGTSLKEADVKSDLKLSANRETCA